jgi:hypothetical protein
MKKVSFLKTPHKNWITSTKIPLSCYWVVIPHDGDQLDGTPYEIAYVYFDGKWSVRRIGMSQYFSIYDFTFVKPIEISENEYNIIIKDCQEKFGNESW